MRLAGYSFCGLVKTVGKGPIEKNVPLSHEAKAGRLRYGLFAVFQQSENQHDGFGSGGEVVWRKAVAALALH
ncbi:hypothetical protein GCM10027018_25480 [Paenibacillus thermoaerophilus]